MDKTQQNKRMGKRVMLISSVILLLLTVISFSKSDNSTLIPIETGSNSVHSSASAWTTSRSIATSSKLVVPQDLFEESWVTLQKYLEVAKNKNIEELKKVSYQLSDSCKNYNLNEANKKDCDTRMDTVAYYGSSFSKKDFINIWSDSRQVIISTEFRHEEDEKMVSRNKGIVYFVRDETGLLKILYFNDALGAIVMKSDAPKEELENRLVRFTEDKDFDGKEDYLEECLSGTQTENCTKTDPKIRDTDQDGLWDGIETLIK